MPTKSSRSAARSERTSRRAVAAGDDPARPRRDRELMAIAVKSFYTYGYAGTSMRGIADEFGVLKGSLYHYIQSKDELLYRVLTEVHDHLEEILEEVAGLEGLPPSKVLREYVRRQITYTSKHVREMAIYYNEGHHLPKAQRRELDAKRERHRAFIDGLIEDMQAAGEAPADLPPGVLANIALGSTIWLYTWYQPSGSVRPEQIADACADFVINGLATGRRRPR